MNFETLTESMLFWIGLAVALLLLILIITHTSIAAVWKLGKKNIGEIIDFKYLHPYEIKPGQWYPLLVFGTSSPRGAASALKLPDIVEVIVQSQIEHKLQNNRPNYRENNVAGGRQIPRGRYLKFTPIAKGLIFDQKRVEHIWDGEIVQQHFELKASEELDGQSVSGAIKVSLWLFTIARLSFTIRVNSQTTCEPFSLSDTPVKRQIFPSYAHEDTAVVLQFEKYYNALGDEYISDRKIPAGDKWEPKLLEYIARSDLFQLFWSHNAEKSEYIPIELQRALKLRKPIYQTLWEDDPPALPEETKSYQAKHISLPQEQEQIQTSHVSLERKTQPRKETRAAYLTAPAISVAGMTANAATPLLAVVGAVLLVGGALGLWVHSHVETRQQDVPPIAIESLTPVPAPSPSVSPVPAGTYNISGRITDSTGEAPLAGIKVTLSDGKTTETDKDGRYTFTGLKAGASYQVKPSSSRYNFASDQTFAKLDQDQQANFRALAFTVSGQVKTPQGVPLAGVKVTLEEIIVTRGKMPVKMTTTDNAGRYSFESINSKSNYTLKAEKSGYDFDPPVESISGLETNQVVNFTVKPKLPDVKVSRQIDGQPKTQGDKVDLTVTITNAGGATAKKVRVSISFARIVRMTGNSLQLKQEQDGKVVWIVDDLPANQSRRLTVSALLVGDWRPPSDDDPKAPKRSNVSQLFLVEAAYEDADGKGYVPLRILTETGVKISAR
jgi:hypothetical protein